jgi:hypothetical protein
LDENKTVDDYKEYTGQFLTIVKKDGRVVKGVLKDITSDGKLKVKGDYAQWLISPESIQDMTARPNTPPDRGDYS